MGIEPIRLHSTCALGASLPPETFWPPSSHKPVLSVTTFYGPRGAKAYQCQQFVFERAEVGAPWVRVR